MEIEPPRRRSSRHSSVESGSSILPKQCIFCKADKYLANTKTRETLILCVQLRADDNIRRLAKERSDSEILAVTTDELIAKEAHYHFTCYRDYVRIRSNDESQQGSSAEVVCDIEGEQDVTGDDDLTDLYKCLNDLHQNLRYTTLKSLQSLVKTKSGKKNLKRTIENKSNDFVFLSSGRDILMYPSSWKTNDIVRKLYEAETKLMEIDQAKEPKAIVHQSGSIMRNEVKNIDYTMPWPPSPEDLNAIDFQIPEHLDSFLSVLISGNNNPQSDRVNRLKLSFAQDLIYAGIYFIISLHKF